MQANINILDHETLIKVTNPKPNTYCIERVLESTKISKMRPGEHIDLGDELSDLAYDVTKEFGIRLYYDKELPLYKILLFRNAINHRREEKKQRMRFKIKELVAKIDGKEYAKRQHVTFKDDDDVCPLDDFYFDDIFSGNNHGESKTLTVSLEGIE